MKVSDPAKSDQSCAAAETTESAAAETTESVAAENTEGAAAEIPEGAAGSQSGDTLMIRCDVVWAYIDFSIWV